MNSCDHCNFSKEILATDHTFCFLIRLTTAYSPQSRAPGFMIGFPFILHRKRVTDHTCRHCEHVREPAEACLNAVRTGLDFSSQHKSAPPFYGPRSCQNWRGPCGSDIFWNCEFRLREKLALNLSHTPLKIDRDILSKLMRKTANHYKLAMTLRVPQSSAHSKVQTLAYADQQCCRLSAALLQRSEWDRDFLGSRVPCIEVNPAELQGRPSSLQP